MSFRLGTTAGIFDGDIHETIERASRAGLDAVEFFDWESVDPAAVTTTASEHDIEIVGTLSAGCGSNIDDAAGHAISYPRSHDAAVADVERSIDGAASVGADVLIVTVGQRLESVSPAAQHNAIVRVLRDVAPRAEDKDVTIVPEPLNTRVDHPGYFLRTSDRGFELVEAVDSPNVKLLYDVYHQQITEGNVIRTLTEHIELVGHVHIADVPGRHEPGTGELNYGNIFDTLVDLGYDGAVSCEFSPTGDPAAAIEDVVALADTARSG